MYFMLLQYFGHLSFELTAIVALKYLEISRRPNLVIVSNHFSHIFSLFCSGLATLYLEATSIPDRIYLYLYVTGHVQQIKLMHLIGNHYFIMRSVNTVLGEVIN